MVQMTSLIDENIFITDEYATVTGQETVGDAEKETLQEAALEWIKILSSCTVTVLMHDAKVYFLCS